MFLFIAFSLVVALSPVPPPRNPEAETSQRYPWPFAPMDQPKRLLSSYHNPLRVDLDSAYFHGGIDIHAPPGSQILAVARGRVRVYSDGGMANVVLTEEDGSVWEYRHVVMGSVPDQIHDAAVSSSWVEVGEVLGDSVRWGTTGYDHLHLNRRGADGSILNPLDYLVPVNDEVSPVIEGILVLPEGGDVPIPPGEDDVIQVRGLVDLAVVATDVVGMNVKGDRSDFHHAPIEFSWTFGDGEAQRFAPCVGRLPQEAALPVPRYPRQKVRDHYLLSGPARCVNPTFTPEGQRFVTLITNVDDQGQVARSGCLDLDQYEPGEYALSVVAVDQAGNRSTSSIRIRVIR